LLRTPLFTATAVLTLAIGMGVNTVAFAVVNGFLFKGYALKGIPGVGRLVTTPGGDESGYASLPEYERFADATAGALDLAAEGRSSIGWRHDGITDTAWVLYVSRNYFSIVDAPMLAGRRAVERSGAAVSAIIGERFWREKLGSPALTGLTLRLNDVDVSVAGIVDGSFTGPAGIYSPDIWLPLDDLALFGSAPVMEQRDSRWLFLMGRLLDGATQAAVHGRVQSAAVDMTRDWPDTHRDRGAAFRMLEGGGGEVRAVTTAAAIGMGIIGLVLLLACFNVANLLLARAAERERDMGIRSALGARPSRLIRLVVTEGVVIAVLSGAVAGRIVCHPDRAATTHRLHARLAGRAVHQHADRCHGSPSRRVAGPRRRARRRAEGAGLAGRQQRRRPAFASTPLARRGADRRVDRVPGDDRPLLAVVRPHRVPRSRVRQG
jgi:hypothetical protein